MSTPRKSRWEVAWSADDLTGECPSWDASAGLLRWVDIEGRRLHTLDPATGKHQELSTAARVGCFTASADGRVLVAMEHAFAWMHADTGETEVIAEPEAARIGNRFNDGGCDRQGRFLASSMNTRRDGPSASLWSLDGDLSVRELAAGSTVGNGLSFSPTGAMMYWADSPRECVYSFDYDPDTGFATNQRVWLDRGHAPGRPDGAAVDADGCYWSARWRGGCVARFTPDGRLDRTIELPVTQVTMCAFGGARLDTLFITSARNHLDETECQRQPLAGSLFAMQVGVTGIAATPFASRSGPVISPQEHWEES